MVWLRLSDQYGRTSLVNMDQVVRIQPVDEGSRLTTTAVDEDGPHRITVLETPDEILALLMRGSVRVEPVESR